MLQAPVVSGLAPAVAVQAPAAVVQAPAEMVLSAEWQVVADPSLVVDSQPESLVVVVVLVVEGG